MSETWAGIEDHPGYEISDHGQVRSYHTRQGHPSAEPRLMSPGIVKGYPQVKLGRGRQVKVHALVLETFVGPRPEGMVARHINSNPLDNRLVNLAWGTLEENYADRHANGTANTGSRHGRAKLTEADIPVIRSRIKDGDLQKDIAADYGVKPSQINAIHKGRTWRHV